MAATDVRNDQTYNGNELRNWRFEILGSHFVSPATGQPWYRTSDNVLYYYNGSENVPMDAKLRTGIPVTNLATFASSALAALLTDETGTGAAVFGTSPTLVTPTLGAATATSINKLTITAPATSATLTLANGSTLATSGAFATTFTFTGATSVTFPTSGTLATTAALASYQPLDSDLTTIAGLTATTDSFMQAKAGAWAARTVAQVKTDLGLTGTNSGDQTITLTGDVTGSGTGSFTTAIAAGVIVNADINAGAAIALSKLATDPLARANHTGTQIASTISNFDTQVRTSRLDQMTAPTSAVAMGGQRVTNVATPSSSTDAANKQYVDDAVVAGTSGIDAKDAVDTVTSANLTLSGVQNINGFTGVAGTTTILVKDQSTASQNGIYVMQSGAWTRRADSDVGKLTKGSYTLVTSGTLAGNSYMLTTADPITVGTTAQTWVQFNAATAFTAGDGIDITSGAVSVSADPLDFVFAMGVLALKKSVVSRIGTGQITGDGTTTSWTIISNNGDLFSTNTVPTTSFALSAGGGYIYPGVTKSNNYQLAVVIKPPLANAEVCNYTMQYMAA